MNLGEVYRFPWGAYRVHRLSPLTLASEERSGTYLVEPDMALAVLEAASETSAIPRSAGTLLDGLSPEPLTSPRVLPGEGRHVNLRTLGALRPGTYVSSPGVPDTWWRPCHARVEGVEPPHVMFLDDMDEGSIYCFDCRRRKPTYVWLRGGIPVGKVPLGFVVPPEIVARYRTAPAGQPETKHPHEGGVPAISSSDPPPNAERNRHNSGNEGHKSGPVREASVIPDGIVPFRPRNLADWLEFRTERAAIFEYLGGFPRARAEQLAAELAGPRP